ncbi:hypothetical protein GGR57DRAFT_486693 [Xylariaceae sp. FL1272]|nr:hypothetical protein GGR57DRAFT_486693 [Xylariaceae sp. FL1272]
MSLLSYIDCRKLLANTLFVLGLSATQSLHTSAYRTITRVLRFILSPKQPPNRISSFLHRRCLAIQSSLRFPQEMWYFTHKSEEVEVELFAFAVYSLTFFTYICLSSLLDLCMEQSLQAQEWWDASAVVGGPWLLFVVCLFGVAGYNLATGMGD